MDNQILIVFLVICVIFLFLYYYIISNNKSNFISPEAQKIYSIVSSPDINFNNFKKNINVDPILYSDVMKLKAGGKLTPENVQQLLTIPQ